MNNLNRIKRAIDEHFEIKTQNSKRKYLVQQVVADLNGCIFKIDDKSYSLF